MAIPSESDLQTQIGNVVDILETFREYCGTNTPNFIGQQDDVVSSLESDYATPVLTGVSAFRGTLNSAMGQAGGMLTPLFTTYGQVIDAAETDTQAIISRLYQHFIDNSLSVKTRGFTYGAVSAGTNTGDGTIYRLNTDENDLDIENVLPEGHTAECVADKYSGATGGEEVFEFRGSDPAIDSLKLNGSGLVSNLRAVTARDSLTGNSSFTFYSGTPAAPTNITDWTVGGNIANFQIDTTNYYRNDPSDGDAPASLMFETNDSVTQKFAVKNITLDPATPYSVHIYYNREVGTADGTLTLTFCGVTTSVVLGAQTGWNRLEIPLTGGNPWMNVFNTTTDNMQVKIELSGSTTGTLLVDDLIFVPWQNFGGLFYLPVGGPVKFLLEDSFTWTDTATESVLQRWFWRGLGRYLPHAAVPTWADPT